MYYHELTDTEKKLLAMMSEIGFGRIENLEIFCGVIALTPESRKISSASFEHADNIHKASRTDGNFLLTDKHIRFINMLRGIRKGTLHAIQITAGLPVRAEIEETIQSL